jgi:hypothetical protein
MGMLTHQYPDVKMSCFACACFAGHGGDEQSPFILLNAADTLSAFVVNSLPDPGRFLRFIGGLIEATVRAGKADHPRVVFCGEGVGPLWVGGKVDAGIRVEQLCNDLPITHEVEILGADAMSSFHCEEDGDKFQSICVEHPDVCSS